MNRCPRHAIRFSSLSGCPLCPGAFDLGYFGALREESRAKRERDRRWITSSIYLLLAILAATTWLAAWR